MNSQFKSTRERAAAGKGKSADTTSRISALRIKKNQ